MASSLGVAFPIKETDAGGIILSTQNELEKVRSNLTAFLMLKRRQRVMQNNMYSPLYDYIMEQWDEFSQSNLKSDLQKKLTEFMPEITVSDIVFNFIEENNQLNLKLIYTINALKISDQITLNIPVQS